MPARCLLCGAKGATCGPVTIGRVYPVDAPVHNVRVAGDRVVPDIAQIQPTDMTPEEREEFAVMSQAYERRRLRNQIGAQGMADGKAPFTSLSYVRCADGVTRKMQPDVARQYVETNKANFPDVEIVREGAQPVAKEGEVIGATKARMQGVEMFDENGRQREEVQPLTSRTFHETDRIKPIAVTPAVGTTGAASDDVMTGTGSLTTSAVQPSEKPADDDESTSTSTPTSGTRPAMRRHTASNAE